MQRKNNMYRWILAAWIMLFGCTMSSAFAYNQTKQSASWSNTLSSYESAPPSYCFRSTSAYTSVVGNTTSFTPLADDPYAGIAKIGGMRRDGNPWDLDDPGEDDDPIGVVADPAPVGTPLVMLLMALAYIGLRIYRRKQA